MRIQLCAGEYRESRPVNDGPEDPVLFRRIQTAGTIQKYPEDPTLLERIQRIQPCSGEIS